MSLDILNRLKAHVGMNRIADGTEGDLRGGRYGEVYAASIVPTKHLLADEGSYFTANNGQTGIAGPAALVVFASGTPFLLIANTDNAGGKNIYMDYAMLLATAAGVNGTNVQFAVTLDTINRYSNGGTQLTPRNVHGGAAAGNSIAAVYAGNITASAAGPTARTIVGNRFAKGAIPVVGDSYALRFGSADMGDSITASTITMTSLNLPPLVIPPGGSALVHMWLAGQTGASSYAPDLGWWER